MNLFMHLTHFIFKLYFSIRLRIEIRYVLLQTITHFCMIPEVHNFLAKYCCYSISVHESKQHQIVNQYNKTISICSFTLISHNLPSTPFTFCFAYSFHQVTIYNTQQRNVSEYIHHVYWSVYHIVRFLEIFNSGLHLFLQ